MPPDASAIANANNCDAILSGKLATARIKCKYTFRRQLAQNELMLLRRCIGAPSSFSTWCISVLRARAARAFETKA